VSYADDLDSDVERENNQMEDEEMHEAILASLLEYTSNQPADPNKGLSDDERHLLEAIRLSKLEDDKAKGKLNLDFLKRKNKQKPAEKSPAKEEVPKMLPPAKPSKIGNGQVINIVPKQLPQTNELPKNNENILKPKVLA